MKRCEVVEGKYVVSEERLTLSIFFTNTPTDLNSYGEILIAEENDR